MLPKSRYALIPIGKLIFCWTRSAAITPNGSGNDILLARLGLRT